MCIVPLLRGKLPLATPEIGGAQLLIVQQCTCICSLVCSVSCTKCARSQFLYRKTTSHTQFVALIKVKIVKSVILLHTFNNENMLIKHVISLLLIGCIVHHWRLQYCYRTLCVFVCVYMDKVPLSMVLIVAVIDRQEGGG